MILVHPCMIKFVEITSALLYQIRSWKTNFDHAELMVKFVTNTEFTEQIENLFNFFHVGIICVSSRS